MNRVRNVSHAVIQTARCPGHFGHIELAEPVLHIAFIDNIYKLLITTCRSCARLKLPQEELEEYHQIMKKEAAYTVISIKHIPTEIIERAKKEKTCPHCGKSQYEMIFTKPTIFIERTELVRTDYSQLQLEKDSRT